MYGFDVFSTPERDAALEKLAEQWLAKLCQLQLPASEALIVGHGI